MENDVIAVEVKSFDSTKLLLEGYAVHYNCKTTPKPRWEDASASCVDGSA
jgi:hypothetical protein